MKSGFAHRHRGALALLIVALALIPRDAHAYIDPGSGSMVYQVLLTGVLAGAFAIRRAVLWIRGRLTGRDESRDAAR